MWRDYFNKGTVINQGQQLTVDKIEFNNCPKTGINEFINPEIGKNMFQELPSEYTVDFKNGSKITGVKLDEDQVSRGKIRGYYESDQDETQSNNMQIGRIIMDNEGYLVIEFDEYVDEEFTDNERQILKDKANDMLSIVFDVLERVCEKDGVKNG